MYLLDTHVLLWYFMGSEKLGNRAKNTIEKNLCFYSTATLWELGIKQSINKIDLKLKISELENIFIKSAFLVVLSVLFAIFVRYIICKL